MSSSSATQSLPPSTGPPAGYLGYFAASSPRQSRLASFDSSEARVARSRSRSIPTPASPKHLEGRDGVTNTGLPCGIANSTSGGRLTYPRFPTFPGPSMPQVGLWASYGQVSGPVLSNLHQPAAPFSMAREGTLPPMAQFGHSLPHSLVYMPGHHHPSLHGPQTERPFRCDQCPQSFNRNHDLKRHKRIHLAVKPFPCQNCDKSFSRKDALKVCIEPTVR